MNKKYITLEYEEYLKLLEDIKLLEDLISSLYKSANGEIQIEISNYMSKHEKWV